MNAPVSVYRFDPPMPQTFVELSRVQLVHSARTDDGIDVPAGTRGTVVGIWPGSEGYEVDFAAGLATVEAAKLIAVE